VRQNPIQRTVSLFICVCIALCTIVAHNIAQNRPDSFSPYPRDDHHSSDDVYLREGGARPDVRSWCCSQYKTTKPQNKSHTNHCDSVPPVDVFCWWADSHTTQNHVPTHKKQYSVHHLLSLILQYFLTDKLATSSITLNHRRSIHHLSSQSKQDIHAQNHSQPGCLG